MELVDEKDIQQEITDSAILRESMHKVLLDMEERLSFNVDTQPGKSLNNRGINLEEGLQSNDSEIKAKLPKIIYDHFQETLLIFSLSSTHLKVQNPWS